MDDTLSEKKLGRVPQKEEIFPQEESQKDVSEKKLGQALQKEGGLNADLQSFIHAVSHYLKSPITAILGFSTLLEEELSHMEETLADKKVDLRPEIGHYTNRIAENAHLLEKMINDLVFISRLEKGDTEPVPVEEVCKDVINSLSSLLQKKNISVDSQKNMPPAPVGREHLHHLLSGLLSNAVKFSLEKSVIFIGFCDGEYFVRDEGIGISEQILDRVFTIFFTTCGKKSMCTGAGLYIVKRIVELYGGSIRIESSPDRGTTVFFRFAEG